MDLDSSSDAGGARFAYRTPFYQKLKQLNTDIYVFQ